MSPSFRLLLSLRAARSTLVIAGLAALAMCAVPLLGVQGPESALALGVLLPALACATCARWVHALRARAGAARAAELITGAVLFSVALVALPALVLWLDGLRVRNCTPLEGFVFIVLGPAFGVTLASLCGLGIGVLTGTRLHDDRSLARAALAASCAAAALPIATMLLAVARFYVTPSIFAYGHFYGMFPGTLYDEEVTLGLPFLWLRVASAIWIFGIGFVLASGVDASTLRFSRAAVREHVPAAVLGVFLCALGLASELASTPLHHTSSRAALREQLGGELGSRRCQLHFPRELSAGDRARLADECDFGVVRAEHFLGVTHPAPVNVYLFRSSDEKQLFMGASGTNIAKPWRSEVYLSEGGFPNPTLGHEIVHVVARGIGAGPLRIAGKLGGLVPDPALIEGVAVAGMWTATGGLTPHEWARAMLDLGLVPKLESIFGPGFLAAQKRLAYTLSGSLLRFVAERHGSAAVRKAYMTGDLAGALGMPLAQLEAEWRAFLASQTLSPRSLALARARFTGPSIFSAVCPHARALLEDELRSDLGAGDDVRASQTCARILEIDPAAENVRAAQVGVLARLGHLAEARRQLGAFTAGDGAPNPFAAQARQTLADEAARRGEHAKALAEYEALLAQPIDEDALRQLQVKAIAQRGSERQAKLLFELLIGEPGERAEGATAVHLARELRAERPDGLPHYLEARQLYFQKRFSRAADLLAEATRLGLPTPELQVEALRVEALARYASNQLDAADALFTRYAADATPAHLADANDFHKRIAWRRAQER